MPQFRPKALSVCLLSFMSMTAMAQTQAVSDDDLPSVELEHMVITAQRQVKQSLGVSNISEGDLERTPVASDISEIVRKMPGVNLTGNSATGQRGNQRQIDIRGMGPENTLILVDGKPITSRNSVRYGWRGERDTRGDSQWVPAGAIQSIEVIRGPAAARYGSGAMGGVVNIITKKTTEGLHGSVELYTNQPEDSQEGDSRRISANLSGSLTDKLGVRLYGNFNKTQMDDPNINPLVRYYNANGTYYMARAAGREGVENKDAGIRLSYEINPKHTLNFDATYGRQSNEYAGDTQHSNRDATLTDPTSAQNASNALLNSLLGSQTNIMRRDGYALSYDGEFDWGDVSLTAQYDKTKNTRLNEGLAGGPEGVITSLAFEDTKLDTKRLHGELTLPLMVGVPQKLTLGAEYVHDKLIDTANTDEGTATGTDRRAIFADYYTSGDRSKMTSRIASVYAEDNLQLSDNTNLVLSARYDHHNKSGGNFSPALNLTHKLNDAWTVKAGVARAYKAPNLYQNSSGYLLYTRGQGCPVYLGNRFRCILQGNDDLKPETSLNTELGVQYKQDNMNASLTYFHNDYKDKIVAGSAVHDTTVIGADTYRLLKWENTPQATISGLEGSITWAKDKARWTNNITYMMKSVDKQTGDPLSLVPNYTWNSVFGYDFNDDWDMNVVFTQYGRQKVRRNAQNVIEVGQLNGPDVRSYNTVSVNAGYRFNDNLQGRIGVNNLFDKQLLRDNSINQTYNETGRAYFASLKYEF